jgi:hypothetical protein
MVKRFQMKPGILLGLFIALGFLAAFWTLSDFGISIDEGYESDNARLSLDIYLNRLREDPFRAFDEIGNANGNIKYYGTASLVSIRWLNNVFASEEADQRFTLFHFGYFVIFQIGVIGMYFLARTFLTDWYSLFVAVIFGTQPLLWGHAFINPKDIPLLTMFVLAVAVGFRMVDSWRDSNLISPDQRTPRQMTTLLSVLFIFNLMLWSSPWMTTKVKDLVRIAYEAEGEGWLGSLFVLLTTSGSLEGYQIIAHLKMLQFYKWLGLLALLIVIFLFIKAARSSASNQQSWILLLLAAGIWGLATSTRTVAVVSGGIVGLYALFKYGRKSIPGLAGYTLTAALVSYITWPFWWVYGFKGLVDSLFFHSDHVWRGTILFEGILFSEHDLPRYYLPKLIAIQFTEPLVALALVGLASVLILRNRDRDWNTRFVLLVLWFVLPIGYVMIARPTLYNNFRQFIFITPPLFIFGGLGFHLLVEKLRSRVAGIAIAGLALLPGFLSIIQLHPLQYSYYNQFVGGVEGAEGQYELDYWGVGWAELAEYVNENIPAGSSILVRRDKSFVDRYFDEQYILGRYPDIPVEEYENFQYVIVRYHDYQQLEWFADHPVIYDLTIDNVAIYQIIQIDPEAD